MPRIAPWHAADADHHHGNSECLYGGLIPLGRRVPGDGGKPLCPLCERLNRAEAQPDPARPTRL